MKSDIPVIILAGGYGTRISEESEFKPKPMVLIGENPILWHIMKLFSIQGFNNFIIATGYKHEIIDEWIAKNNNDYIAKAITFSSDINYLSNIKSELAQRVNTSSLFDTNKFYKNFKDCLLNII